MKTRGQKGQSLVETSLILAAFVGLLAGMAGIAQMLFVKQTFSQRVREAARWGALHAYDPTAIRKIVLYGTAVPDPGASALLGLAGSEVLVTAPDCPGAKCRVTVAIPKRGIHITEPAEYDPHATDGVPSKP